MEPERVGVSIVPGPPESFERPAAGTPACPLHEGTLSGTITAADVVGPIAQGMPANSRDELVLATRRGATYVNVHTTGFPGGEIRAQLR